jgi:hypothetical protein
MDFLEVVVLIVVMLVPFSPSVENIAELQFYL